MKTIRIGGRRYTSQEAFRRFVQATNGESPAARTPKQRERAIAQAEAELAKAGI